jgi:hypothetical protein
MYYRPNEKTDLGDILDQDQNAQRRVTMADNALLQVRNREANHVVGDDAMHVVTKYETTFEDATQQTVTMDMKIKLTHHMDTKYEAHLEEEDVSEAYDRMAAMSTTDDAQHQLMHGQSIPRAFFMNKALPEAKEETKRGLQFLHISDETIGDHCCCQEAPDARCRPKEK